MDTGIAFQQNQQAPRFFNGQLALILLLAAILRFEQIRQPYVDAFSWRQTDTAMMAENFFRHNNNIFYPEVNWTGPGPGYQGREFQTVTYLSAMLYQLVGQHAWVGRSVSVLFGLWGILAFYHVVHLCWDREHAIVAALVMAVMPGAIFIDRSFLPDPAMVALIVTSLWLWLRYLQTGLWRHLLLGGIVGAWGASTKIPGLIIGLPMAYAWFALTNPRRRWRPRKLARAMLFATLILVPTIAYYLWAHHLALSYPPYHFAGEGNWLWDSGIARWVNEQYYLPELLDNYRVWIWRWPLIGLVALGLVIRPTESSEKGSESSRAIPYLFHVWMIAAVIYFLLGARELVNNPWNFHIVNPPAAALASASILWLAKQLQRRWTPAALAIIAFLLLLIGTVGQVGLNWMAHPFAHDDYRLGLALQDISQPGDLVVTFNGALGDPTAVYYSQRRGWPFPPLHAWNQPLRDDDEAIMVFEDLQARGADWLGIVASRRVQLWEQRPALIAHIQETTTLVTENESFTIYHISLQKGDRPGN